MATHLLIKYPHMTLEKIYDLYMKEIAVKLPCDVEVQIIDDLYEEVGQAVRSAKYKLEKFDSKIAICYADT